MRAKEIVPSKLVIFDIDDTLMHTSAKVNVIDPEGKLVKELDSAEFAQFDNDPVIKQTMQDNGWQYDFGRFRSAQEFYDHSVPIWPIVHILKQDLNAGNKVVMVTARADLDDKNTFIKTFKKAGIPMNKIHVYRAGNVNVKASTSDKKAIIISGLMKSGNYKEVIMYDDNLDNLHSFKALHQQFPHTKFIAHQVDPHTGSTNMHEAKKNYHFAGDRVGQKTGPAGQLKGKSRRAARAGDLVGGC